MLCEAHYWRLPGPVIAKQVRRTEWTRDQKNQACIQYAIEGNLSKIARDTGIPRTTVNDWSKEEWWVESTVKLRHEKLQEHRAQYIKIVDLAQQQVLLKIGDASAAQANLIACQATDKVRLHDGMPTSITSKDNRELAEVWKELSRTMRDHGVVSTQHKVNQDK